MSQLNLLCYLDDLYTVLLDYERQDKLLDETLLKNDKTINIINIEKNIHSLKNRHKNTKSKLKNAEQLLKEYNYIIDEIEEKLYSGKISDLKQLEYLSEEKDNIKEIINDTEMRFKNIDIKT